MKTEFDCKVTTLQKESTPDEKEIQKLPRILSKTDYVIQNLFTRCQTAPQTTPFKIIKYIAKHCLSPFIETTTGLSEYPFGVLFNEKTPTSCIHTTCMLASLLLGPKKAYKLHTMLRASSYYGRYVQLSSYKTTILKVNAFDGLLFARAQKDKIDLMTTTPEELCQSTPDYVEKDVNHFFDQICSKIDEIKSYNMSGNVIQFVYKKLFKEVDYDCNVHTIKLLQESMLLNESKISSIKSCIYFISISSPIINSNHVITQTNVEHEFLIEQFKKNDNTIGYRLLQSMIDQATLYDDIQLRSYGENGENSWDQKGVLNFLHSLCDLYTLNEKTRTQKSYKTCFGYAPQCDMEKRLISFDQSTFSGISLRYVMQEINPQDTIQHLNEILDSDPLLLRYFCT